MAKHSDIKADKALIKTMVKPSAMKKSGGGIKKLGMTAGSYSGVGRLQKARAYRKSK